MARFNEEFKYSIVTRMMPPKNESVQTIARETGLTEATLYNWKKNAKSKGMAVPGGETESERWSTQDKFSIVVETATLSEIELAGYCRSKGLSVEQIQAWRNACMQANGSVAEEVNPVLNQSLHIVKRVQIKFGCGILHGCSGRLKVSI
ncbi:transposase [Paenibacillus crassostreae]|uniref:transposase n=1 Tax=Paenibacillus crassostreae TaxID=1763538 RepID=UPI0009ED0B60|nr:transposase [Paenibacillus crassostreae]